ncbi:MAG: hypothetical protein ACI8Z1_002160 [Candidatus Azotimanducaceae bacterium]|jgi:hypothetical protein
MKFLLAIFGVAIMFSRAASLAEVVQPSSGLSADDRQIVVDLESGDVIALRRVTSPGVKIDGHLDESIWAELPAFDEFVVISPDTFDKTDHETRVKIFYDASGLYFGIDMNQPADTLIRRLSGRDKGNLNRDAINITLDTSGAGRYGFWFGLNLGDSLSDGTLLPERQFSNDWDGAWRGASQITETGWSGEFHIPWGTVAMPSVEGQRKLGLFMSRKVAYLDERYGWPALPSTVPVFISALQSLTLDNINPKQQFSIYPFTAVTDDRIDGRVRYRSGADFFWRPSSNFQLTATLNPDFGSVEADEVDVNLTATETFFPEKRLFFLEGRDVFIATPRSVRRGGGVGGAGAPTTLLNTRRIGGRPIEPILSDEFDIPERELIQPVELIGALKVTGEAGQLRYGVLAAFEDDLKLDVTRSGDPTHLPVESSDYGVVRILYEDEPGGAYRSIGLLSTAALNDVRTAKTHGVDGHYLSGDGKLKIDGQAYTSIIEDEKNGFGGFVDFEYTFRQGVSQRLGIEFQDEHVDINDVGFLQRNDSLRIRSAHIRRSSDISWARDNEFDLRGFAQRNKDGLFTGGGIFLSDRMTFDNLSRLTLRLNFLPEQYDDLNSFDNGTYRIEERHSGTFLWASDSSQALSIGIGGGYSKEHLGGTTKIARVMANWRPNDQFAVSLNVRYRYRDGWLLHQEDRNLTTFKTEEWTPKLSVDYFLTARQQFRFSLQWFGVKAKEDEFYRVSNEPGDLLEVSKPIGPDDSFTLSDMTMQLRYRWEIAPLSDVFLVYTRVVDQSGPLKSFSDSFSDGYDNPIGDFLVLKLRYRFGS